MKRTYALLQKLLLIAALAQTFVAHAQTRYWVGGDGRWADAAQWSTTPAGPGGAGAPRNDDDAVIQAAGPLNITIDAAVACRALSVDAGHAAVRFNGPARARLEISGAWSSRGDVAWQGAWPVELSVRRQGVEVDLRGATVAGDVVLDGSGSWSIVSDLSIGGALRIKQGTLIANMARITAQRVVAEAPARGSILAGRSIWALSVMPEGDILRTLLQPNTTLAVEGMVQQPDMSAVAGDDRDINICGTDPGQTPFTVNAQVVTNYNGFGVRCRGQCNATVTVTVTGGSGNFSYIWLNGGPPTQTWTTACGGPQLVVVTDVTQGISCPVLVNVNEPAPLGVIFFGQGTPPSCADVCNGTRTALAVGGVPQHIYNWNNGAGSSSSFNQLCAGLNTLQIRDANQCTFDTTFFFNVQPIVPNLTFTNANCFGECDGTATVAPTGGNNNFTITWTPPPPVQGGLSVNGLCAGNYSVRVADSNGCDSTQTFVITEPPPFTVASVIAPATCANTCNGTATLTITGSAGPYSYAWSPAPGAGQGTNAATGLCAGTYTVLVTDVPTGCDTLVSVLINAPPPFVVQANVSDASCSNTCDGAIGIAVSGGSPGYSFLWAPAPPVGQGTPNISQLCPGNWAVTVTDVAGCDTTLQFTVNAPPPLNVQLTSADVSCAGACDGTATIIVTGGTPNYSHLWTPTPVSGQGTTSVSGLCAGSHSVRVTDFNGCDTTVTFVITEPLPLAATSSQTNVTCGSLCDGTAAVVVIGGTTNYTYAWTPAPATGQGTANASGFCAGPVSVLITDANGCTLTVPFVIQAAVPIQLSLQLTPASCPGVCDGAAGVIVSGGVANYTYAWSPAPGAGQGTANVTGLCPQAYSLTVTDAVGCDTTISFTITAPDPIVPNATQTDVTCAGDCDGRITLAPTGGNGTFTYLWVPAPALGQGTATASGLCAGNISVTITSGACDTTIAFVITEPAPIIASISTTDASCPGVCDGTATVIASGGTGVLTYTWAPAPGAGQGTAAVTGLCAGPHTVTITDAAGCDTTIAFVINEPLPITTTQSHTNVSCGSTCDGTASVVVSGGTPSYTYVWTPAPATGQGTPNATGFCAGPVSVLITDSRGCSITVPFLIEESSPILLSLQLTPTSCPNTCDGSAGVIASGGAGGFTYSWSPAPGAGQGTPNATLLCAQAYSLTVTDAVGCDTTIAFTITAPSPIEANATQTDATCSDVCNGIIILAPTGGTGVYTYVWSPTPPIGSGTANVAGLCAGDWSVTILSGGCDTTFTFTINAPLPITADLQVTGISCAGECDASASAPASGGTGVLTYFWSPAPASGQGTPNAVGFCSGLHQLTISDAAGCDTTITFDIVEPLPITASVITTAETCDGPCTGTASLSAAGGTGNIQILWQPAPGGGQGTLNATGLCAGTAYSVTLTDDNGCTTTLDFTIDPSAVIIPNISSTPATCNGICNGTATAGPVGGTGTYTYVWSPPPPIGQNTPSVAGLCAGVYQVTITDASGCSVVAQVLITEPPPIISDAVITDPLCNAACNGSIVLSTSGGGGAFTYTWSPQPPVGQGTASISGLCAGTWNVLVSGGPGCTQSATYVTTDPAPLTLSVTTTPSQCQVCIGSATAVFGGGTGTLLVEWQTALGVVVSNTADATDLCAGVYLVTVRDANGCTVQQLVAITDSDGEVLSTTNGTTSCPNTCDGTVTVDFTCSDPACSVLWSDDLGNTIGTDVNSVSGLCPGTYYVLVTNGSGCVSIDTATAVAPVVLTLGISSTAVSCSGECDGTATVGIADGTPPYTITWDPAPPIGQGTPAVSQLCAGVYEVTVADGNGCETVGQVLITEPPPLSIFSSIVIGTSCAGDCNGNITLVVQGGSGSYSYLWSPAPATGQGASAAFGFCAGNVTVTITDTNGCSLQRTFTVTEPQPLAVSTTSTQSTCPVCDGTATATVTGGTGSYTYSWVLGGAEVSTDASPTGLCAGIYSLTVTDDFGCFVQAVVTVTDATGEDLQVTDGQKLCANVCDAAVSVDFTCTAIPCSIVWFDVDGDTLAQDVNVLSGLCAGVYTVQVTNGNGCVSIAEAVVSPSSLILANISSTPVSCPGACDGIATAGPIGGVDPYTFTWSPEPGGGQGTPQATGLCAGVYDLLITDQVGCDTTVQVLILEPPPIVVNAVVSDANCAGTCDGSIVATPSGGTGAFTFNWDPAPPSGQGSNGAFDLCAGDYTLTVTDANGCTAVFTYTVGEPAPLVLAGASISSECGVCNGQASVAASGGQDPYTYLWTLQGAIFGTDATLNNICAGLYSVRVTDDAGCVADLLVPVQDLNGEVLTTAADTTSCPGICDGNAEVIFNCGEPACTVAWYDAAGNDLGLATEQISNLCGGLYLVTVTNGLGCLSIDTAFVAEPDPIIANLSTTPVTCFGDCDGTATVGPTGGVPPFMFLWDPEPSNGQNTPLAEGLCAGPGEVTITDDSGCSIVVPFLILSPTQLTATAVSTPITCNGDCDGTIVITAQGGVLNYTYNWSPEPPNGQGTNTGTELCAGTWSCLVTDANGCTTTVVVEITEPPVLEATMATTNNDCFAQCEGEAVLDINGGVAPYTIVWTDGNGTVVANDVVQLEQLCAGAYNARITDDNGCVIDVPFTITEGSPIVANLVFTGETCAGPCDGTAGVAPTGGAGSYTYDWQPDPGMGQGTDQVTGLCAGNYTVVIADALGCDTTITFTVLPYTPISDNAVVNDVNCNGACDGSVATTATGGIGSLSYVWSPVPQNGQGGATATGYCPGDIELVVTDAVGCGATFSYTITEPPVLELTVNTVTDASCATASDGAITTTAFGGVPSYTFAWSGPGGFTAITEDLSGLAPGDYDLVLTDANSCVLNTTVTVGALISVVADAGADQEVCSGTTTTLDGTASTGAVTWSWRDANNVEIANTPTVTLPTLSDGVHEFTLIVSDGPCTSTDVVTITVLALPIADAGDDQAIFLSETATLGGNPAGPMGSTFTWTPDSLLNAANVPNPVADPTLTTWFTLTVVAPNGCVDVDSVLITVVPTVVIPNGFTPNADGRNDVWQIDFIDLFPDCVVEVYNRWGEMLFRSVGYNQPWDGRYRDGLVPVGTYYYVIELNDERFPEPYTGPLTIIR